MRKIKGLLKERDDSVVKAASFYVVCQIITRGMAFITTPIFARLMSHSQYGMVNQFLACEAILYPILTLNFRDIINKSKYDYKEDNDSFLLSILLFSQCFTIFAFVISEIFSTQIIGFLKLERKYLRMIYIYIIFYQAFDYQQIQSNIFRKYKRFVLYSIINSILSLSLSVILVSTLSDKAFGRILGIVIPTIIIYLFVQYSVIRRGKRVSLGYIRYALTRSMPLLPAALSATLLSSSDRIMITYYFSSNETAMYAIAYTISSIAGVAFAALNQAWGPWMLDMLSNEKYDQLRKYSWCFTKLYISIIIVIILLAPEILLALGGKSYLEATAAMPPVIIAMACQFFYAFYFNIEYFYGETVTISLGTVLAGVVNVLLNLYYVPRYGYIAASYTTMVGYFILLIYNYCLSTYKLNKSSVLYNNRFFMSIVFIICIQILASRIYHLSLVRYIILAIYLSLMMMIFVKKKDIIIGFIKRN